MIFDGGSVLEGRTSVFVQAMSQSFCPVLAQKAGDLANDHHQVLARDEAGGGYCIDVDLKTGSDII